MMSQTSHSQSGGNCSGRAIFGHSHSTLSGLACATSALRKSSVSVAESVGEMASELLKALLQAHLGHRFGDPSEPPGSFSFRELDASPLNPSPEHRLRDLPQTV